MFSLMIFILIAAIGFMMGFVYKRSYTTAQFFQIEPKRVLRIFTIIFGVAVVLTLGLSWFTMYMLGDGSVAGNDTMKQLQAKDLAMKFMDIQSIMVFLMNVSFLALMVLANLYSQTVKKVSPVPYLLVIAFYVLFVLKDAYYISDYFAIWQQSKELLQGDLPDFHSKAWMKAFIASSITAFNAGMVWWGLRK